MHNRVEIAEEPIPIQEERPAVRQMEKNAITVAKSDIFQNTASPKQRQNNRSTGSILITSLPKDIRYQNIRYQVILTMSSPLTFMINRNNHK